MLRTTPVAIAGVNCINPNALLGIVQLPLVSAPRRHVYSRHTEISLKRNQPCYRGGINDPVLWVSICWISYFMHKNSPRALTAISSSKIVDRSCRGFGSASMPRYWRHNRVSQTSTVVCKRFISASFETSDCTNKQSVPASVEPCFTSGSASSWENHFSSCNTECFSGCLCQFLKVLQSKPLYFQVSSFFL